MHMTEGNQRNAGEVRNKREPPAALKKLVIKMLGVLFFTKAPRVEDAAEDLQTTLRTRGGCCPGTNSSVCLEVTNFLQAA
jgi:hypothetical protein